TAYEIVRYWSSDVCSSDLAVRHIELEPRRSTRLHVRVHVPETGDEELALAVHHLGACRRSRVLRDAGNCSAADHHRAIRNDPSRSEERRVGKERRSRRAWI